MFISLASWASRTYNEATIVKPESKIVSNEGIKSKRKIRKYIKGNSDSERKIN